MTYKKIIETKLGLKKKHMTKLPAEKLEILGRFYTEYKSNCSNFSIIQRRKKLQVHEAILTLSSSVSSSVQLGFFVDEKSGKLKPEQVLLIVDSKKLRFIQVPLLHSTTIAVIWLHFALNSLSWNNSDLFKTEALSEYRKCLQISILQEEPWANYSVKLKLFT